MNIRKWRYLSPALVAAATVSVLLGAAPRPVQAQQAGAEPGALRGDVGRGERYFTSGYKCYACHGYDAQSGTRLVPLRFEQDAFIVFVQNSPLPQMPAYNDMPAQALADVYAYIQSLPDDAPDVDDIDLLSAIRDRQLEDFE